MTQPTISQNKKWFYDELDTAKKDEIHDKSKKFYIKSLNVNSELYNKYKDYVRRKVY